MGRVARNWVRLTGARCDVTLFGVEWSDKENEMIPTNNEADA